MIKILTFINNRLQIYLLLVLILSILGFLGNHYFLFDIFSQFRLQYVIFAIICLLLDICLKNKLKVSHKIVYILSASIIFINLLLIFPYIGHSPQKVDSKDLKIALMNVLTSNNGYKDVLDTIDQNKPDVIFLEEVNNEWLSNMKVLDKIYPYSIKHPREDNFGVAFYSKSPISNKAIKDFGSFDLPSIICSISHNNQKYNIIGIHTTPPSNKDYFANRNLMINNLSKEIIYKQIPTIIIGDLNTTMYSPIYISLINKTKLIDPRKEYGINPTWSPKTKLGDGGIVEKIFKIFFIPIDHILCTSELKITSYKVGKSIGSDHLPVIATVKYKN